MLFFTKYKCTWLTAMSKSLSRWITCPDGYIQQSHATKRLLPPYKVNVWKFVAMSLLRNKDQQKNNPLATFVTHLYRKRRGHEWTASSSLHDTITVNLTLVQREFHTGKETVIARIKSINRIKLPTSGFSRNIWFLIPIPFYRPCGSLTILYQVSQTRPPHLMKRRNVFD